MSFNSLVPLREYCRSHPWPRLSQWHHWIYSENTIAKKCVKRIGGRYMVDVLAFQEFVEKAGLNNCKGGGQNDV